ncbi:MAG: ankyrin repeat domain-containing protein, partial [Acidobacteriota bacterium]
MATLTLSVGDPLAVAVTGAIQAGNVEELRRLLDDHRGLATAGIVDAKGCERSLLHVATDWPGHFPHVAGTISLLVDHGADVNARIKGASSETPLHWVASSDDVDALVALMDRGANIEADGAVIGGGT